MADGGISRNTARKETEGHPNKGEKSSGGKKGRRNSNERQGGEDAEKNAHPVIGNGAKPKSAYPAGPTLTALGEKIGYPHRPLDRDGRALCYGFSAHSGCASKRASRAFSHQSRIKPEGLHWATSYEIARLGGLESGKRIGPQSADGYLQALRGQRATEVKKSIEDSRNVFGNTHYSRERDCLVRSNGEVTTPPGLLDESDIAKGISTVSDELSSPPGIAPMLALGRSTNRLSSSARRNTAIWPNMLTITWIQSLRIS